VNLSEKIKNIIAEQGLSFKERSRTIYTYCPVCGRDDKFSILKQNGACICYRATCDFGKRWFVDWIVLTANISHTEAKALLAGVEINQFEDENGQLQINLNDPTEVDVSNFNNIKPVKFPEFHMIKIDQTEAFDGQKYLESRGIPTNIAAEYDIYYSPVFRRVYFPVKVNGTTCGYQGRHIDAVPNSDRVRNNEGFSREQLVMFLDKTQDNDYVIISEGPIDAIKFHFAGSNICTMGKIITEKQQKLIFNKKIKKIYLALDEDADIESRQLYRKYGDRIFFLVKIPESAKIRCANLNKKADFGECTFEECLQAFKGAEELTGSELIIYLK
jgi:hypothetical protein